MKAVMDSIMDDDFALWRFEEDTKKKQTPSTRRRKNKIELFCWLMIVEAIVCILRLPVIQFEVSDKKQKIICYKTSSNHSLKAWTTIYRPKQHHLHHKEELTN